MPSLKASHPKLHQTIVCMPLHEALVDSTISQNTQDLHILLFPAFPSFPSAASSSSSSSAVSLPLSFICLHSVSYTDSNLSLPALLSLLFLFPNPHLNSISTILCNDHIPFLHPFLLLFLLLFLRLLFSFLLPYLLPFLLPSPPPP